MNKTFVRVRGFCRKAAGPAIAAGSLALTQLAHAVDSAEVTAAKAAIASTQTDVTGILGVVLVMGVAVWGVYKLIKIFGGK